MKLSSLLPYSNRLISGSPMVLPLILSLFAMIGYKIILPSSIWIRNLVLDGDVEANPGPDIPLLGESNQMLSTLPSLPLTYFPTALGTTWLESRTIDNYMLDLLSRQDYPGITYFPPDSVNDFFNESGTGTWQTHCPLNHVFLEQRNLSPKLSNIVAILDFQN
ncbi:hypothetical protein RCL1_007963 [Eukaryota sp. TZLM3-RCL]